MSLKTTTIEKTKLILVEGKDEIGVFTALLKCLGREDVQVVEVGGKDQFALKLPAVIKAPDFQNVVAYAVVQDADKDPKAAFSQVQQVLRKNNQPVPRTAGKFTSRDGVTVGILILPGGGKVGMLEDIFLETIRSQPVTACVDAYFNCISQHYNNKAGSGAFGLPGNRSKARVLAALAATDGPVIRLGEAASAGYWAFSHNAVKPMIDFLTAL